MWELKKYRYFSLVVISHLALIYTLAFGSSTQISAMIILHVMNIWIAGTVTYHRLISHRSWNAPRWFEVFGTLLGVFSFTGSSVTRAIFHRQHHMYPDTRRDPHSPWINSKIQQYFPMLFYDGVVNLKLGKDVYRDPFHKFVHHNYLLIILIVFSLVAIFFGLEWSVCTILAPGALSWITIYLGNTLCHLGPDPESRACDNWFITIIAFGEGWHGYHHKNPTDPKFGNHWYDPGWWIIKILDKRRPNE